MSKEKCVKIFNLSAFFIRLKLSYSFFFRSPINPSKKLIPATANPISWAWFSFLPVCGSSSFFLLLSTLFAIGVSEGRVGLFLGVSGVVGVNGVLGLTGVSGTYLTGTSSPGLPGTGFTFSPGLPTSGW